MSVRILAPQAAAALERPAAGGAVVDLDDPRALDPALVGAKAAALARATAEGLPVLPGFVITTAVTGGEQPLGDTVRQELEVAWRRLSEQGLHPVVVRSSSTLEDGQSTSMAGMFTSVLDVRGPERFFEAVEEVLASRKAIPGIETAPMAVLVQPQLAATAGGVMFGADPVTGRTDRLVVAAVEGTPEHLVSGTTDGAHYLLSLRGRCLKADHPVAAVRRRDLRALSRLAKRVAAVFGGPQDVEWALGPDGTLHLLQSRPITAVGHETGVTGPVLGPGPVAETFPDPLSPLEEDLWVSPLRSGLAEALSLAGAVSRRRRAASPIVVTVGGRVAADLALLGQGSGAKRGLARLDPRPPARRLRASWRVGRLRASLPALAGDLIAEVDRQLLAVPAVEEQRDHHLVDLLDRSHQALVALHGHEVLVGLLVAPGAPGTTGAALALRALGDARRDGVPDDEIVVRHPVVLSLVPPAIGVPASLPRTAAFAGSAPEPVRAPDPAAMLREALRLRVRWVQELTARAAWELGRRLQARDLLADAELVRYLRRSELRTAVGGAMPERLVERRQAAAVPPLPAAFRLTPAGQVVEVDAAAKKKRGKGQVTGRGAGGGRGSGRVHDGVGMPDAGDVLVVRTLDPTLATVLPHLGGLVSETGSVLSHLAVLAREFGVPVVVGVPDALRRFPPGAEILVDGTTGEVVVLAGAPPVEEGRRRPEQVAAGQRRSA